MERQDRKTIELLAPAKSLECGRVAIDHGADAVYIGAPRFGARRAAANTVEDIAALADYAHLFGARVHVALNTLLLDNEVDDARRLAWDVYRAGADVLIVQDMALLRGPMPPIELHASTQCDNRDADKVLFWQQVGMSQVVLARELSVNEIAAIASQTRVRLEAFVHGALCVSYSGQCYMSLVRGGRSANRGECAQPCRLAYDLAGADGAMLRRKAHVLSLRDNCQASNLEELIDAGVSSFKIEGRLKDADYVANVTLHYRRLLDKVMERRHDLRRLSSGRVEPAFEPALAKSFNRGFTDYFAHGRQADIWQPLTPKSIGEPLGKAESVKAGGRFAIRTQLTVSNGDGLCFFGRGGLTGIRVNTASRAGSGLVEVTAQDVRGLRGGEMIYRNSDVAFADALRHDKTARKIDLRLTLSYAQGRLSLRLEDEDGVRTEVGATATASAARDQAAAARLMTAQLSKMGGTPFFPVSVDVRPDAAAIFVPSAELNALRRAAIEAHIAARMAHFRPMAVERSEQPGARFPKAVLGREANVVNSEARAFYEAHGSRVEEWGYERLLPAGKGVRVMTMRHCLLFSMGKCLKTHPECAALVPLSLTDADGRRFEARPDCKVCQMGVFTA